jgi:hypothetical protein
MLPWNEDWCQFTPKPNRVSIIPMWDIWMKWQSLGALLELAHLCLYESGQGFDASLDAGRSGQRRITAPRGTRRRAFTTALHAH